MKIIPVYNSFANVAIHPEESSDSAAYVYIRVNNDM